MARSKLQEATPKLLEFIRAGLTYEDACEMAGITYRTFCNWRKRATDELKRVDEEKEKRERKKQGENVGPLGSLSISRKEKPYIDFLNQVNQARIEGQLVLADVIRTSAVGGQRIEKKLEETWYDENNVVIKKHERTITEELPPDWRAAGWILDRRGWKPVEMVGIELILPFLTDDELEQIENGGNPGAIIAAKLANSR